MPRLIEAPTRIAAAGTPVKIIEEFVGRVNSGTSKLSVAQMTSPQGWSEPPQTPDFDEYTLVLQGALHVRSGEEVTVVRAGQAIIAQAGETVQYFTPEPEGAVYIAVCAPAFSPDTVHRHETAS